MKKYALPTIILIVLFIAKYLQIPSYCGTFNYSTTVMLFITSLMLLTSVFSLISILSIIQLTGKFKWNSLVALLGSLFLILSMYIYPSNLWIHLYGFSQIFIAISFFLYIYPYHDYENRKYPAFGTAFLTIYMLLEYTSLLRGQCDFWIFTIYLTISIVMFIPGFYLFSRNSSLEEE